jgi:hypothetical protein
MNEQIKQDLIEILNIAEQSVDDYYSSNYDFSGEEDIKQRIKRVRQHFKLT